MQQPKTINGLTFEMAQTMTDGTKFKSIQKFSKYLTPAFGVDDLAAEADIAIWSAWCSWEPEKGSKFNTYATNMLRWKLYRALDINNPRFAMTFKTKSDLRYRGITFDILKEKGVTEDAEFNEKYGLDGKAQFTRDMFNDYIAKVTAVTFKCEIFTHADVVPPQPDQDIPFDVISQAVKDALTERTDPFEIVEQLDYAKQFGIEKQRVVEMLIAGEDLLTIAREMGMSRFQLAKKFGNLDLKKVAKKKAKKHETYDSS